MSKNLKEHGFVSTIQQRTNHKDLQNCLFACFLSQEEPKKMSSMGELTFFLGLQVKQKKDGIFISQDKYVDEILKKFRFIEVKTAIHKGTHKPLLKDENGKAKKSVRLMMEKQFGIELELILVTQRTTSTTLTARLPILNPVEYDLWLMRIEQYFLMTDYSLWEVILNGNKVLKRTVRETKQEYEPTTAEEKQDRRNEIKARGTLLMALLNKDQLKFYSYKDEKLLMEAIKKRYGGNKESKKV
ncbi:hypothetical protein Tco_0672622 [Tanacetum coccineum]